MTNNDKAISKKDNLELTEQNLLMLKHIEKGKTIKEAYQLAGYEGQHSHAAYQLYHRLKKKLELIYESDNTDSLRLKIAAKKILDLPIKDEPVKPEVRLKAIETIHKLSGNEQKEKKAISPFIVFKAEDGKVEAIEGKVIEAKEVKDEEIE